MRGKKNQEMKRLDKDRAGAQGRKRDLVRAEDSGSAEVSLQDLLVQDLHGWRFLEPLYSSW